MRYNTCPNCGGDKPEAYTLCYPCQMKEDGQIECEECSEGYHDPQYDRCFHCNTKKRDKESTTWLDKFSPNS